MKTLSVGTSVQVMAGKHKGKMAIIKQADELQLCCFVDNLYYLWFFPSSLKACKPASVKRRKNTKIQMNLFD